MRVFLYRADIWKSGTVPPFSPGTFRLDPLESSHVASHVKVEEFTD